MASSPAATPTSAGRSPRRRAQAIGWMAVAVAAGYSNSFPGIFAFDDVSSVIENPTIRQLWPAGPVLQPPVAAGVGGRPVANLTLALNHALSGVQPWSYHVLNVLLHGAVALAWYGVVRRTLETLAPRERWARVAHPLALASAVIWAVHPLATAVVNYVSQRTEGLMALGALATLYAFIRSATTRTGASCWRAVAVSACGLGMACKETMVVVPLLVLLYDRAFIAGTWGAVWRDRRGTHLALAGTWLVVVFLMLQSQLAERGVGFGLGVSSIDYALTQAEAVTRYLRLAFWPAPLVFDHGWAFQSDLAAAAPHLLAVAAVLVGTVIASRRSSAWGFAAAWIVLLLAPSSSVIPIVQQPLAESRMYLPLAALVTASVVGAWLCLRSRRSVAIVLLVAVTSACLATTLRRNRDYRDEVTLWSDTVAKVTTNARAHANLGAALLRAGRNEAAIAASTEALRLRPDYADARHNLGTAQLRHGDPVAAIASFHAALAVRPQSADTHFNLGEALLLTGRTDGAIAAFETALRLNPAHAPAHNNLGVVLLAQGHVEAAIAHNRAALRLNPSFAEAHYNLGNALARTPDLAEAEAAYTTALQLQPVFPRARNNLGALLLRTGRRDEAVTQFEAALLQAPDYADARRNLAIARQR